MIFEGPLVILAVGAMTAFHPGRVFGADLWIAAGKGVRSVGAAGKFADSDDSDISLNGKEWHQAAYQRVEQPVDVV
jgi:hypothetical protein